MRVTFATEPAHQERPNEDFVAATPDAVALLDGAGTPTDMESGCAHGVAWYARTLGAALLAGMTQSAGTLAEILANSIQAVATQHGPACDLSHPGSPSATVIMLRHTADTVEWLVLADSVLILDLGEEEPMVICDDREGQIGARYRKAMDALPGGSTQHGHALRDYIETMRDHRNRDGGFWVASIDPRAAEQAFTGAIPAGRVRAAALLSDGASRLVDRFHLSTWPKLLAILDQAGPVDLIRQVRTAERGDLSGSRWPRGKTFDDATAVHCLL